MDQSKIDRINELARKAKTEGLTDDETAERQKLREEYIAAYRASLRSQLDSIVVQTPDGEKTPLKKKNSDGLPS